MIERIAYTVAEVAEMTGIPYGTVLAEIRAGNIVARRAGVSYYVHRDTLDGYLKCPAPKKPARLWQRYDSPEESGRKSDSFVWIILDEGRQISTGHRGRYGRSAAEKSLVRHLSEKHSDIPSRPLPVEEVSVDAVLDIYLKNLRNDMASPERQPCPPSAPLEQFGVIA